MDRISEIRYPIKAACLLSGLPADTLRAWERRYGAVIPDRKNGRRLYSQADIERLKLLKWAVDHGHRIGHVAKLSDSNLRAIQGQNAMTETDEASSPHRLDEIIDLMKNYRVEADAELTKLASLLTPRAFVFDVVQPILRQIGDQWESGDLTVAQEHFTSAGVRNILGILIRTYGSNADAPAIVFGTPPGELHEFGILISAMIVSINGFRPVYLGPNLPVAEIARTAKKTHALAVVIGINDDDTEVSESVAELRDALPHETHLIVGGSHCEAVQVQRAPSVSIAPTFEILEQLVEELKEKMDGISHL